MENLNPNDPLENEVEPEPEIEPKTNQNKLPEFGITRDCVSSVEQPKNERKNRKFTPRQIKALREYLDLDSWEEQ
jgi:hypothetical protein